MEGEEKKNNTEVIMMCAARGKQEKGLKVFREK